MTLKTHKRTPAPTRRAGQHPPQRRTRRHGGARQGAGAPPGNLNAIKNGRRSKKVQAAVNVLLSNPLTAHLLIALFHAVLGDPRQARREIDNALHAATDAELAALQEEPLAATDAAPVPL